MGTLNLSPNTVNCFHFHPVVHHSRKSSSRQLNERTFCSRQSMRMGRLHHSLLLLSSSSLSAAAAFHALGLAACLIPCQRLKGVNVVPQEQF